MVTVSYRKRSDGIFTGRVCVYDNGRYMYSLSTEIMRINQQDAIYDARKLAEEIEPIEAQATTGGVKR